MTLNARNLEAIVAEASEGQRAAANPLTSAWVAASAGTGKTRVLTNRFLRLLLLGEPPESLLALTFTKAAAAEMSGRITNQLEDWAQSDDDTLRAKLSALIDRDPTPQETTCARLLFTRSLSLPQGFNIQTIHSFCGSLLQRFPIEAALAPDSRQVDEHGAAALLGEVIGALAVDLPPQDPVRQAMDRLLIRLTPEALTDLLSHAVAERARIADALKAHGEQGGVLAQLAHDLKLPSDLAQEADGPAQIRKSLFDADDQQRRTDLTQLSAGIAGSTAAFATTLKAALAMVLAGIDPDFDDYGAAFLTTRGEPRKPTIKELKNDPVMAALFDAEAVRVMEAREQLNAWQLLALNKDFLCVADRAINNLARLKRQRNVIDFDDMILMAAALLGADDNYGSGSGSDDERQSAAQWVQYKLDQGVRHLMVDEAQDTNPDQWRVIQALSREFFAGAGTQSASGLDRTVFVVGDLKQSIFGFQRADPNLFKRGRERFHELAAMAEKPWLDQPLTTTFRCAPAILDAVNAVFQQPGMAEGLSFDDGGLWDQHFSARRNEYGQVVLHPPLIKPKRQQAEGWAAAPGEALTLDDEFDATDVLAGQIASQIAHWTAPLPAAAYDDSQWLSTEQGGARRVTPGDILILLKKRGLFADKLISNLQALHVPVAGADRLRLMDQLVIKDLAVLADASLQPADDLAVATLLRSPLATVDDAELEELAIARLDPSTGLFDALVNRAQDHEQLQQPLAFLRACQHLAQSLPAYEFFASVLYGKLGFDSTGSERLLARLGNDILDPIHELLAQARLFESDSPPTLQKFLIWLRERDESIKRDLDAANDGDGDDDAGADGDGAGDGDLRTNRGQVRIMTAHASKGLEAPIVILGDAFQKSTARWSSKLIWTQTTQPACPIWSPSSDDDSEHTTIIKNKSKKDQELEDRRLLYVAMTRAEERLHIFGMRDDSDAAQNAGWYKAIEGGMASLCDPTDVLVLPLTNDRQWQGPRFEWQTGALSPANDPSLLPRMTTRAPGPPGTATQLGNPTLPPWAKAPPLPEPSPPKPLSPSRLDPEAEKSLAAPSPIDHRTKNRFLRGTLIHSLFKVLPDLVPAQWESAGGKLLGKPSYGFTRQEIDDMLGSVIAILNDPNHAALFGPGSRAEVPLSGVVDQVPIAGQVDRLVEIQDAKGQVSQVLVIDYKTNRPPPSQEQDVSRLYLLQMTAYGKILRQIYPNARIRPFLLWTDSAQLMELKQWERLKIPGAVDATPGQLSLL